MASFKLTCDIMTEEGREEREIFAKDVSDEHEAERNAKYYFINKGLIFYGVTKCKSI